MSYILAIFGSIILLGSVNTNCLEAASLRSKSHSKKSSPKSNKNTFANADVAHQVLTGWYGGVYSHRGFYRIDNNDITIATIFQDNTGQLIIGAQYVIVNAYPYPVISISSSWKNETINGVQYVVYTHSKFLVYSTDYEQFIVDR